KDIIAAYQECVVCKPRPKAMVVYDSMWGATEMMARAIAEGAAAEGVEVMVLAVRQNDITDLTTDILDAAALACGSSTLNQGMMPAMAALLTYWKGLRPMGKCGFAFGSYGWGKGGPEAVDAMLRDMKFEILRPPLLSQYRPTPAVLEECRVAGGLLAARCSACRD
ncbi:MAG: flavodoxin domain-containing protein, partial [Planctomycetota bacterium]|nr:flavodoxin domain-containing protein [Planctomycetota bacterium]